MSPDRGLVLREIGNTGLVEECPHAWRVIRPHDIERQTHVHLDVAPWAQSRILAHQSEGVRSLCVGRRRSEYVHLASLRGQEPGDEP